VTFHDVLSASCKEQKQPGFGILLKKTVNAPDEATAPENRNCGRKMRGGGKEGDSPGGGDGRE